MEEQSQKLNSQYDEIFGLCDSNLLINGILQFPILTQEENDYLLSEAKKVKVNQEFNYAGGNSMHKHAFSSSEVQFDYDKLIEKFQSLINYYFLEQPDKKLRISTAFYIHYEEGYDKKLDLHTDDSDITFNLCLGDEFEGNDVIYIGNQINKVFRNPKNHGQDLRTSLKKGIGQIFRGRHPHHVEVITKGSRWNLVIWCKYI